MHQAKYSITAIGLLFISGCTHIQLRNNSLHQAQSAHQLYEQQVLDNLAMFVANPNTVPYFTVIAGGTSAVNDQGSASTTLNWLRSGFQSVGLTVGGNRLVQENFSLAPLSNPDKLARMRCAYQRAVGHQGSECIDCNGLDLQWGDRKWDGWPASEPLPEHCFPATGWFCVGCKNDVPKGACYVGRCGKTYVWIPPHGTEQFALLTLTILDYATAVPSPVPTKTVKTITKYPPGPDGSERTIEETEVVAVRPFSRTGHGEAFAPESALPATPSGAIRQEYFQPQPLTPVVIPLLP